MIKTIRYIYLLLVLVSVNAYSKSRQLYSNVYGHVQNRDYKAVKNAVLENVLIYAQENDESKRKIPRKGILLRNKYAKATILICHGFMCDKFDVGILRHIFPRNKYNLMSFDFRAHGEDTADQYSTLGRDEAYDVISAAKFLRGHPDLKNKPLFVYGFSMGAVAAIEAQAKYGDLFDAMILDCPFDSSENVIKKGLEKMKFSLFGYEFDIPGKSLLQQYAFHPYVQSLVKFILKAIANMDPKNIQTKIHPINPVQSIAKVTIPCFFIHCRNDEKVPVKAVKSVFEKAAGYKVLWITNGRGHFDSIFYSPEQYTEYVQQFFDRVVNRKINAYSKRDIIIEDKDDGVKIRKG